MIACGIPRTTTEDTASLIDNLFTNLELKSTDVVTEDFSEHLMLVADLHLIKEFTKPMKGKISVTGKNSLSRIEVFFSLSDLSSCLKSSDPDFAAEFFANEFKAFKTL